MVSYRDDIEEAKKNAACKACDIVSKKVSSNTILGLGTGSTIKYFIDECRKFIEGFKGVVVSSFDTLYYVLEKGLNVSIHDPLSIEKIDIYVDGADEVSATLDLVKGRGAALLREKYLALRSGIRVYIVDYTKYTGVEYLYKKPIPVEVIPFALPIVLENIRRLGLFTPVLRLGIKKDGPIVTDNGNFIVDLKPIKPIRDPFEIDRELRLIHGVVETGIFPSRELVDIVVVGYSDHVDILEKKSIV